MVLPDQQLEFFLSSPNKLNAFLHSSDSNVQQICTAKFEPILRKITFQGLNRGDVETVCLMLRVINYLAIQSHQKGIYLLLKIGLFEVLDKILLHIFHHLNDKNHNWKMALKLFMECCLTIVPLQNEQSKWFKTHISTLLKIILKAFLQLNISRMVIDFMNQILQSFQREDTYKIRTVVYNSNEIMHTCKSLINRLSELGDYETQSTLIEMIVRVTPSSVRGKVASDWHATETLTALFKSINYEDFDQTVRAYLNAVNQNPHSRVLSISIDHVSLSNDVYTDHCWLDLCLHSCKITISFASPEEDNVLICDSISREMVKNYHIEDEQIYLCLVIETEILLSNIFGEEIVGDDGHVIRMKMNKDAVDQDALSSSLSSILSKKEMKHSRPRQQAVPGNSSVHPPAQTSPKDSYSQNVVLDSQPHFKESKPTTAVPMQVMSTSSFEHRSLSKQQYYGGRKLQLEKVNEDAGTVQVPTSNPNTTQPTPRISCPANGYTAKHAFSKDIVPETQGIDDDEDSFNNLHLSQLEEHHPPYRKSAEPILSTSMNSDCAIQCTLAAHASQKETMRESTSKKSNRSSNASSSTSGEKPSKKLQAKRPSKVSSQKISKVPVDEQKPLLLSNNSDKETSLHRNERKSLPPKVPSNVKAMDEKSNKVDIHHKRSFTFSCKDGSLKDEPNPVSPDLPILPSGDISDPPASRRRRSRRLSSRDNPIKNTPSSGKTDEPVVKKPVQTKSKKSKKSRELVSEQNRQLENLESNLLKKVGDHRHMKINEDSPSRKKDLTPSSGAPKSGSLPVKKVRRRRRLTAEDVAARILSGDSGDEDARAMAPGITSLRETPAMTMRRTPRSSGEPNNCDNSLKSVVSRNSVSKSPRARPESCLNKSGGQAKQESFYSGKKLRFTVDPYQFQAADTISDWKKAANYKKRCSFESSGVSSVCSTTSEVSWVKKHRRSQSAKKAKKPIKTFEPKRKQLKQPIRRKEVDSDPQERSSPIQAVLHSPESARDACMASPEFHKMSFHDESSVCDEDNQSEAVSAVSKSSAVEPWPVQMPACFTMLHEEGSPATLTPNSQCTHISTVKTPSVNTNMVTSSISDRETPKKLSCMMRMTNNATPVGDRESPKRPPSRMAKPISRTLTNTSCSGKSKPLKRLHFNRELKKPMRKSSRLERELRFHPGTKKKDQLGDVVGVIEQNMDEVGKAWQLFAQDRKCSLNKFLLDFKGLASKHDLILQRVSDAEERSLEQMRQRQEELERLLAGSDQLANDVGHANDVFHKEQRQRENEFEKTMSALSRQVSDELKKLMVAS